MASRAGPIDQATKWITSAEAGSERAESFGLPD